MSISRKPSLSRRHEYAMTREEALKRGLDFYYTGKRCKGRYGNHDDFRYAATGICCECKRLDNQRQWSRRRQKSPERKAYQKKWREEVQSLGLRYGGMPGGGAGYRALIPQGAIAKPDDAKTNRAARQKCKGKNERDHVVPQPQSRNFNKPIIGLEVAENLQVLTPAVNRSKSSGLPHPNDFTKPADQPLTLEEMRWFVQHRMAIWAHDVIYATRKGEQAVVRWELYRLGPDGLVEYLGEEPVLAEAAE